MTNRNAALNPALRRPVDDLPRNQRRVALAREAALRKSGTWPAWQYTRLRHGQVGSTGWLPLIVAAHHNTIFTVLERPCDGGIIHLMINSLSGIRPTFHEAQRIKNELAGTEATAVEVYPPQSELVDDADAYHLWILPEPFPATIYGGKRS